VTGGRFVCHVFDEHVFDEDDKQKTVKNYKEELK